MNYRANTARSEDFKVNYRFLSAEEGGRKTGLPAQGYRSDWSYEEDDVSATGVFMIWPEFEGADMEVLPEGSIAPMKGTARMWIVSDEYREYHRNKLKVGTKGYFMEGSIRVAAAEVCELVGLCVNET